MAYTFQGGNSASWSTYNPVLGRRVVGVETDTARYKTGDGQTKWRDLPYGGDTGVYPRYRVNNLGKFQVAERAGSSYADVFDAAGRPGTDGVPPTDGSGEAVLLHRLTNGAALSAPPPAPEASAGATEVFATSPIPVTGTFNTSVSFPASMPVTAATALPVEVEGTVPVSGTFYPATQPVSGAVSVSNLPAVQDVEVQGEVDVRVLGTVPVTGTFYPATQPVSGEFYPPVQPVSGTFYPPTQPVSGTVQVGNLPANQRVSGEVAVSNLPATQPVSGSIGVTNFPSVQPVTGDFYPAVQPVVLNQVLPVRVEAQTSWTLSEQSLANTAKTVTKAGVANVAHSVLGFEVSLGSANATAPVVVKLLTGSTVLWRTRFSPSAPNGSRIQTTFPVPLGLPAGAAVSLEVSAGGADVVADLNLAGFSR